jgi:hypothetical protein
MYFYKIMMMNLTDFGNFILGNGPAAFSMASSSMTTNAEKNQLSISVRRPAKRGRSSASDDINRFCIFVLTAFVQIGN